MRQEELKELFLTKNLTTREVASQMGCSPTNVCYWLKKYGIRKNQRHLYKDSGNKMCPQCRKSKPLSQFYKRKGGLPGSWCKNCMGNQTLKRQKEHKKRAVEYKGGKCLTCGFGRYEGALEFHHLNPLTKDSKISQLSRRKMTCLIQRELDKCVLLCANCHRMAHAGLILFDAQGHVQKK